MKTESDAAAEPEATSGGSATGRWARAGRGVEPRSLVRPAVIAALVACAFLFIPSIFSLYYVNAWTQVAIYSIVTLGLGVLVGRVGMVSLGQGAVLAMGAWVSARLLFATGLPYPLVLLLGGLITMVLGTLVGLPALRMSGLYLALITLMLAGAITIVLQNINFPNGGNGFTGYDAASVHIPPIRRPDIATSDPAFFRYSVIVAVLMFLLVLVHLRGRPGRAWAAIRQSESAALAGGINTTLYKLWAFALASFITGVAGGLVAGFYHYLNSLTFATADSITLLAVVLMGGAYSLTGAVVAAFLLKFLQQLLNDVGRLPRLADDPVRNRRAPGADHRAAGDRRADAQGPRPAVGVDPWSVLAPGR